MKLLQEFSTSEVFKKAEESVKVLLIESRNEDIRWILTAMFDKKTKLQLGQDRTPHRKKIKRK